MLTITRILLAIVILVVVAIAFALAWHWDIRRTARRPGAAPGLPRTLAEHQRRRRKAAP